MSWSDRGRRRRLIGGLGALAVLAGCGFRPVYGPAGSGQALSGRTLVSQSGGTAGFLLARALEDRLGPARDPRYRLGYTVSVTSERVAISTARTTNRFNLIGRADWRLTTAAGDAPVASGQVDGFNGYSALGTALSTAAANADALERLMVVLADQILEDLYALPEPVR